MCAFLSMTSIRYSCWEDSFIITVPINKRQKTSWSYLCHSKIPLITQTTKNSILKTIKSTKQHIIYLTRGIGILVVQEFHRTVVTIISVDLMNTTVSDRLIIKIQDDQMHWLSIVCETCHRRIAAASWNIPGLLLKLNLSQWVEVWHKKLETVFFCLRICSWIFTLFNFSVYSFLILSVFPHWKSPWWWTLN